MAKFLHVGFVWSGPVKTKELEPVFDQANDWMRYSNSCWIIWTTLDAGQWASRVKPYMSPNDGVLICELSPNISQSQGWNSKLVWNWINKTRGLARLET